MAFSRTSAAPGIQLGFCGDHREIFTSTGRTHITDQGSPSTSEDSVVWRKIIYIQVKLLDHAFALLEVSKVDWAVGRWGGSLIGEILRKKMSFSSSASSVLVLTSEGGLVSSKLTLWLSGWSVKLRVAIMHLPCLQPWISREYVLQKWGWHLYHSLHSKKEKQVFIF